MRLLVPTDLLHLRSTDLETLMPELACYYRSRHNLRKRYPWSFIMWVCAFVYVLYYRLVCVVFARWKDEKDEWCFVLIYTVLATEHPAFLINFESSDTSLSKSVMVDAYWGREGTVDRAGLAYLVATMRRPISIPRLIPLSDSFDTHGHAHCPTGPTEYAHVSPIILSIYIQFPEVLTNQTCISTL